MLRHRLTLLLILQLCCCSMLVAGPRWQKFKNWIDSADVRGCDTTYVTLPRQPFIGSVNYKLLSSHLRIASDEDAQVGCRVPDATLSTQLSSLSLRVDYRGWGFSYTRGLRNAHDYQFTFSSYGQAYGVEVLLLRSRSLSGSFDEANAPLTASPVERPNLDIREGMTSLHSSYLDCYYVFSHHRFSLPAAMSQTVRQRRSAGSWLSVLNYHYNQFRLIDSGMADLMRLRRLSLTQFSLGGGYAYNHVFGREHFLLYGQLMPMLVFLHRSRVYAEEQSEGGHLRQQLNVNLSARCGLVYNHSRYVAGIAAIYLLDSMRSDGNFSFYSHNFTARCFFGVRF